MSGNVSVEEIQRLSTTVNGLVEDLQKGKIHARRELLIASRSLYLAVETPMEAILRMTWAEPALSAALRTSLDLKLFELLSGENDTPKDVIQLANAAGVEPVLLGRLLKHMAAMGTVKEIGAGGFAKTPLSDALIPSNQQGSFKVGETLFIPTFRALPQFLLENGYRDPGDENSLAFHIGLQTSLPFFKYLKEHPKVSEDFNNLMSSYSLDRKKWTDPTSVPVHDILGQGLKSDKDAVLLVDIGGNVGHDLIRFKEQYPDLSGRLVLQDLAHVIEAARPNLPEGIEAMAHDFFHIQPVEGARAYYLHEIFHDWPNSACTEMLSKITPAMTKGYSKILIHENVIPDSDAYWEVSGLDMLMMGLFSGRERSAALWHEMLESVGLKIINIWTYEKGTESIIEAELA